MLSKERTKLIIERIGEKLKLIYNKANFFIISLICLVFTLISFIIVEMMILKELIDNRYLIVYTVNNVITTSPYTQIQALELMKKISVVINPYAFGYYYFGTMTLLCFMIGIYKFVRKKLGVSNV